MAEPRRRVVGAEEADLVAAAKRRPADIAGHYIDNYRTVYQGRPALLRLERVADRGMDARMLRESEVLAFLSPTAARVPRLLYDGGSFLLETFVPGDNFDLTVEDWETAYRAVLAELALVHDADCTAMSTRPPDFAGWLDWLQRFLDGLWSRLQPSYAERFSSLGVPPLKAIWPDFSKSIDSPVARLRLVHGDLHQDNILRDGPRVTLVDWELALVADPVWDAAVALHRTRWTTPEQRRRAEELWCHYLSALLPSSDVDASLSAYLRLELWKSLVVDSVRYPLEIRSSDVRKSLADRRTADLVRKLQSLAELCDLVVPGPERVRSLMDSWIGSD